MPNDNVLTTRQRMDLLLVADDMAVSGDAELADALRALLAAHPGQPELAKCSDGGACGAGGYCDACPQRRSEPRAEVTLTDAQIDMIANDGYRNAAGGIYSTRVYDFARDCIDAARTGGAS